MLQTVNVAEGIRDYSPSVQFSLQYINAPAVEIAGKVIAKYKTTIHRTLTLFVQDDDSVDIFVITLVCSQDEAFYLQ